MGLTANCNWPVDVASFERLAECQSHDSDIAACLSWIANGIRSSWNTVKSCMPFLMPLFRQWKHLMVKYGDCGDVLYRVFSDSNDCEKYCQAVLPNSLIPEVLKCVHKTVGHCAKRRAQVYVQSICYWYTWKSDIRTFFSNCSDCSRFNQSSGNCCLWPFKRSRDLSFPPQRTMDSVTNGQVWCKLGDGCQSESTPGMVPLDMPREQTVTSIVVRHGDDSVVCCLGQVSPAA